MTELEKLTKFVENRTKPIIDSFSTANNDINRDIKGIGEINTGESFINQYIFISSVLFRSKDYQRAKDSINDCLDLLKSNNTTDRDFLYILFLAPSLTDGFKKFCLKHILETTIFNKKNSTFRLKKLLLTNTVMDHSTCSFNDDRLKKDNYELYLCNLMINKYNDLFSNKDLLYIKKLIFNYSLKDK